MKARDLVPVLTYEPMFWDILPCGDRFLDIELDRLAGSTLI